MVGSLFLWLYWPSFNSALLSGTAKQRAVINTVLSLTGSTLAVFIASPIFNEGKISMSDVINAILAGGVSMGTSADLVSSPFGAIIIGIVGGLISNFGFRMFTPYLSKSKILVDVCGV